MWSDRKEKDGFKTAHSVPHAPPFYFRLNSVAGRILAAWPLSSAWDAQHLNAWNSSCSVAQSCLTLCDPMDCRRQASLSITNSWRLLKLMCIAKSISNFSLIIMKFLTELKNLQSVWTKEIKKHYIYLHAKGRNLHGGLWLWLYYWVQDSEPRSIISEWKTLKQIECQLHLWQAARFPVLKIGLYHFTHCW